MATPTTNIIRFVQPQTDVFKDKSNILLVDGPTGNGKSTIIQEKLHAYLKKYPKSNGLIIRKSLESTKNSVVIRYINEICDREPHIVKYNQDDSRFEYSNGSYLFVAGVKNEAQRKALKGIGSGGSIHFVVIEEAAELFEYDFDEIVSRCRGDSPAGWRQIILTCNPEGEDHWINQRFILPHEHLPSLRDDYIYNKVPAVTRITWATEFNPSADEQQLNNLKGLSGVMYNRNYLGKWVSPSGVVYPDFRRAVHEIPAFDIPNSWEKYRSIDFGNVDPSVCIWATRNPTNNHLFIYKYIYRTNLTISEFADLINEVNGRDKILYSVSDHHAGDRASLARAGIPTILANKDISVGVKTVTQRLRIEKPSIFFFEDALDNGPDMLDVDPELRKSKRPKTGLEEFSSYAWGKKSDGRVLDVPLDKDNHFCLVAGTMIETLEYKDLPIEEISIGDIVKTREGYGEVVACGITDYNAEIYTVHTRYKTLSGTRDHPIMTRRGIYVPLGELQEGELLEHCPFWDDTDFIVTKVIKEDKRQPVYNVSVGNLNGSGNYFANSISVSNCDALRYLCMIVDQSKVGAVVITQEDIADLKEKMIADRLNNKSPNTGALVF